MRKNNYIFSLTVIGLLYFVFGFITWLNNLLIPFLQTACDLPDPRLAYLVTFAFYISYFVMALPSSYILKRTGFAKGICWGLTVMALGSILFIPAARTRSYTLFLTGLFVQGTGLALLQTAVNPYVTILGPIESAAKRISIMGLFNKIAGIIGILSLSHVLLNNVNLNEVSLLQGAEKEIYLTNLANRIITPYIIITIGLLALAVMVYAARLPEIEPEKNADKDGETKSIFSYPYLWLGIAALFLYEGAEVMAIDTLVPYANSIADVPPAIGNRIGSFSMLCFTLGYCLGVPFVPKFISQRNALIVCACLSLLFSIAAIVFNGVVSLIFIILLSLSNSLMWPGIWPLAIDKLGRHTKTASALLIMAIVGGALIPFIYRALATALGNDLHMAYVLFLPCYLFILYFACRGCTIGKNQN